MGICKWRLWEAWPGNEGRGQREWWNDGIGSNAVQLALAVIAASDRLIRGGKVGF